MIESVLTRKQVSAKTKLTVKALIAAGIVALAVVLPQLAHLLVGAPAGVRWLPMYLPVLLGGCLLGVRWGVGIGLAAPLCSFLCTTLAGSPMPAAVRLPFMMAELAVFGLVSGAFSGKIARQPLWAFPAVLLAQLSGRGLFLLLVAVFQAAVPFTPALIAGQIAAGWPGLVLQLLAVPGMVAGLRYFLREGGRS